MSRPPWTCCEVKPFSGASRSALELQSAPLEVICNASQIQQAFTNLLVNAAEALSGQGRITIKSWRDSASGRAAVSFADTGCGIPAESLGQIFEPFFTTKQEGHGTGLGLAIVYGIVERHGGTIKVDSRLGEGTTFTVWLPETGSRGGDRLNNGASILIVDDEHTMREACQEVLDSEGFQLLQGLIGRRSPGPHSGGVPSIC